MLSRVSSTLFVCEVSPRREAGGSHDPYDDDYAVTRMEHEDENEASLYSHLLPRFRFPVLQYRLTRNLESVGWRREIRTPSTGFAGRIVPTTN